MTWQAGLGGIVALVGLYLMVRAFQGLGVARRRADRDSADLWLHADTTSHKGQPDGPVTGDESSDTD